VRVRLRSSTQSAAAEALAASAVRASASMGAEKLGRPFGAREGPG
jgi:hypothetical protein